MPAMAAEIQVLKAPQIIAETANLAISPLRLGARVLKTPICIPTLPRLAKPQRAYVTMMVERSERTSL
jgi:hypothetical protein